MVIYASVVRHVIVCKDMAISLNMPMSRMMILVIRGFVGRGGRLLLMVVGKFGFVCIRDWLIGIHFIVCYEELCFGVYLMQFVSYSSSTSCNNLYIYNDQPTKQTTKQFYIYSIQQTKVLKLTVQVVSQKNVPQVKHATVG